LKYPVPSGVVLPRQPEGRNSHMAKTPRRQPTAPRRQPLRGFVMLHTPSNSWHPGHAAVKVYHDEHDARANYAKYQGWDGTTWVPVEVVIREAKPSTIRTKGGE
jgi:hypothetical protein